MNIIYYFIEKIVNFKPIRIIIKLIVSVLSKIPFLGKVINKLKHEYLYIIEKNTNKTITDQQTTADYLHQNYIGKKLETFSLKPKKDLVGKKIIWSFWGQGIDENTPAVVQTCFSSMKKHCTDYELIVLNNDTISDYVDLPDFVYEKFHNKQFEYPFFSDLIRISLLSVYGGVWMDATIYMTDKIPQKLFKNDFFVFQRGKKPLDHEQWHKDGFFYFSWEKGFKVNLFSPFIIANPDNPLIVELTQTLLNYWKNETKLHHYFVLHILYNEIISKYKNCEIICDTVPNNIIKYIDQPYNKQLWQQITNNSFIHKLTYYDKVKKDSILEHILKQG